MNSRLTVGLTKNNGVWVDSSFGSVSPISFKIDWQDGEPNNVGGIENCLAIHKKCMKTAMIDVECGNERDAQSSFICSHIDYL